eukprot:2004678-Rhodomonas_salina.1
MMIKLRASGCQWRLRPLTVNDSDSERPGPPAGRGCHMRAARRRVHPNLNVPPSQAASVDWDSDASGRRGFRVPAGVHWHWQRARVTVRVTAVSRRGHGAARSRFSESSAGDDRGSWARVPSSEPESTRRTRITVTYHLHDDAASLHASDVTP